MSRAALDLLTRALESAFRADHWHSLLANLSDVRPQEWDARPAEPRVSVFGPSPELSIADIVNHVGSAKHMYADRAFGGASAEWGDFRPPSGDKEAAIAWLEEAHHAFADAVKTLDDDSELAVERRAPWSPAVPTERLISIIINHDLYHAGEINRQRALIRGADGWE